MKTLFSQTGKILTILCIGLLFLAVILPMELPASGGILRLQTAFDNGLVDVTKPGERHLEILVTAPETMEAVSRKRLPLNIALVIDK